MNIRCPYCGCCYSIDRSLLKEPIGSEQLGYGWWLRCYKCHKKWWLRHVQVEHETNQPLRADRREKIEKISKLSKKPKHSTKKTLNMKHTWKILVVLVLLGIGLFAYSKRYVFAEYLAEKAEYISSKMLKKISLKDVRYFINDGKISIKGKLLNEDEIVSNIDGIRVTINKAGEEILKWEKTLANQNIMPGQSLDFETSHEFQEDNKDLKVEVSIY